MDNNIIEYYYPLTLSPYMKIAKNALFENFTVVLPLK